MPTTTPFNNLITFSRGSNATVTGSNGLIQWAPNNLLTQSESFDAAAWTKQGNGVAIAPTVTANAGVAPDGTTTADRVQFSLNGGTATGDISQMFQSVTFTAAPVIFSVYLKSNTASSFNMQITNPDGSATAITVTPDWQRFSGISATAAGAVNYQIRLRGGQAPANNNTADVLVWGAQLELGSTATTHNPTTVKNLLGFSEAFDNAAWTKSNSSIVTGAQANPVNGLFNAQKLMENTANTAHRVQQTVNISGAPITLSAYLKAGERTWAYLRLDDASSVKFAYFNLATGAAGFTTSGVTSSITSVGSGWYRCSITFAAPAATAIGTGVIGSTTADNTATNVGDGNSGVYIYGAQLSDSASLDPYVPTPGAAPSSTAFYGPRFDFDPVTLQPRGLLVEEQRTNLATFSDQFDNAAWTKLNATVTANATASPDGTVNADKLAEDATAGVGHLISQGPTLTAAAHTYSVYAKASERNWVCLLNNSIINGFAFFNVAAGTIGTVGAGATATITNTGNGWYRCSITFTAIAATNNCHIRLAPSDNVLTYNGVAGNGAFIYGAQLEVGAFATSYIPTVASTVTRSADVATIAGQNFAQWYGPTAGTFVAEFQTLFSGAAPATVYALTADANVSKRFVYIGSGSEQAATFDGTTIVTAAGDITGPAAKVASVYDVSGRAIVSNGGAVTSGAVVAGYSTASLLNIGNFSGSSGFGWFRNIRFIPARAADFQLQALST